MMYSAVEVTETAGVKLLKQERARRVVEHQTSANLIAYKGDDMATSQNTPVVIGGTLSASIKSTNVNKMKEVSKAAGLSLSGILDRAIEQWLEIEAPVYVAHAERNGDQQV
jgi:hypothetical protein